MKRKYFEPIFIKAKTFYDQDLLAMSAEDAGGSLDGDWDDFDDFFGDDGPPPTNPQTGEDEGPVIDWEW